MEYTIPRMGKRADCILLSGHVVCVIEFKIDSDSFDRSAKKQVEGYALDLKNFHELSHNLPIVPILICTKAHERSFEIKYDFKDLVAEVICTNGNNLSEIISSSERNLPDYLLKRNFSTQNWMESSYKPTPTIIEAARALYGGHKVEDISRSEAGAEELPKTREAIFKVIKRSRENYQKSICFVTGVPGSGKTLVGLDIASYSRQKHEKGKAEEHAVFLSGNGPLVDVLREALAQDRKERCGETLETARREVSAFIQNVHHFRDEALNNTDVVSEHVVIFDEAQRAWDFHQTSKFMKTKRGQKDFNQSEPEFLIDIMDRRQDWAVIICLIGGGQEINTGEAGLAEWFVALRKRFKDDWHIYISSALTETEYTNGQDLFRGLKIENDPEIQKNLHLSVSNRSFRSEKLSAFIKSLLDIKSDAGALYQEVTGPDANQIVTEESKYPLFITRDLEQARSALRDMKKGTESAGIVASSGALRLKPLALNVKSKTMKPTIWFLASDEDVRSSDFLEEVATEFEIQGLELDYVCVAWDVNFRFNGQEWEYFRFSGSKWKNINKKEEQVYLKNAYRVLLTRARKGMIIFVPTGSIKD